HGRAVDEDRTPLAGDLIDECAVVEGVLAQRLGAEELDVARGAEQQREHHEAHDCDVAECPVHARPPSGCVPCGAVSGSSSVTEVGRTPVANSSWGRRALSLMRRSRPMMIQFATSE